VLAPADIEHPIVQAPMAGGPSTPELAAAVSGAGGLGFLAAGYRAPEDVRDHIAALRGLTERPFGLNLFAPPGPAGDPVEVSGYAAGLRAEAARAGTELGEPRHDDDALAAKVALAAEERVPVVSFTFGLPPGEALTALHDAGAAVWVTVTSAEEAAEAAELGADALVVQGTEAGGHRGGFDDHGPADIGLLALLQLVSARTARPLVATGGIATGAGVAAVLAAGADAAQLGTVFLRCPEAATPAAQRDALGGEAATALTRAFTGRRARGIVNRFMTANEHAAPSAYPEVHHLTAPMRAAARAAGDADSFNLWAGQAYPLAPDGVPAAELVSSLAAEARAALERAGRRLER
jgi:nitronate monooxygenase